MNLSVLFGRDGSDTDLGAGTGLLTVGLRSPFSRLSLLPVAGGAHVLTGFAV